MTWWQFVLAISGALAWPLVIVACLVVLKRTFTMSAEDQRISALSTQERQGLREFGGTLYSYNPFTGVPDLDHPITIKHLKRFDKRHPDYEDFQAHLDEVFDGNPARPRAEGH